MKTRKTQNKKFDKWYNGYFLASRDPTSPLLVGENKTVQAKFQRIGIICKILLESKGEELQVVRKKIAREFFVSMRCALDYINYARNILEEWEEDQNFH